MEFNPGEITTIRYFTAHLINRPHDKTIAQRQQVYLRALKTLPELKIHLGQFKSREVRGCLMDERTQKATIKIVTIQKYEEKGSDVNIASHMLADGFQKQFDAAILISNDSDLAAPMQIIKEVIGKPVGLISPDSFFMTELSKHASFKRRIREEHLAASQFPDVLTDAHGSFKKPPCWNGIA